MRRVCPCSDHGEGVSILYGDGDGDSVQIII